MTLRRLIPYAQVTAFALSGMRAGVFVGTGLAALAWGWVPPEEIRLTGTVVLRPAGDRLPAAGGAAQRESSELARRQPLQLSRIFCVRFFQRLQLRTTSRSISSASRLPPRASDALPSGCEWEPPHSDLS